MHWESAHHRPAPTPGRQPRSSIALHFVFPFAHHVHNPHFHHAARLDVSVSAELCLDRDSPAYMMGIDTLALRSRIEGELRRRVANRYLVWAAESAAAEALPMDRDKGVLVPDLDPVLWPARPTVEAVMLVCALIAESAISFAAEQHPRIESVTFFETARTSASLSGDQLTCALAHAYEHLGAVALH